MMRIKVIEILKFLVAVAIGFTLRVMFENSDNLMKRQESFDNTKYPNSGLNLENIHEQLRQPHQPSSIRDIIEYRYFNLSVVFDTHLGNIQTKMKQYHQSDILDTMKQAEALINAGVKNRYKTNRIINGFERIDPVRGKEYVLDLELIPESSTNTNIKPRIVRLHLVKPFSYVQMDVNTDVFATDSKNIHLLYIVNGSNIEYIKYILAHHDAHIVDRFPVNVTIYVCSTGPLNPNVKLEVDAFSDKRKAVSSYKIGLVVDDSCKLQASETINKAVQSSIQKDSKVVILDINVNVTYQFLQRCYYTINTSPDSVYVPIPFAKFLHLSPNPGNEYVNEASGVWDHDNYEILCLRKELFDQVSGLNQGDYSSQAFKSILNKFILMKKQIFRSTDPSVTVSYHNLKCQAQDELKYSSLSYCQERQRRTFQSLRDIWKSIPLN